MKGVGGSGVGEGGGAKREVDMLVVSCMGSTVSRQKERERERERE